MNNELLARCATDLRDWNPAGDVEANARRVLAWAEQHAPGSFPGITPKMLGAAMNGYVFWLQGPTTYLDMARALTAAFRAAPMPGALPVAPPTEGGELEDDDPLWCINSQIEGLLEGCGAPEDHEDVLTFLRATGLPERTVARMHRALVWGDIKIMPRQVGAS